MTCRKPEWLVADAQSPQGRPPKNHPNLLWAGVNLAAMSAVVLKRSADLEGWADGPLFVAASACLLHGLLLVFDHWMRRIDV